jgi:hypothetical protein
LSAVTDFASGEMEVEGITVKIGLEVDFGRETAT